MRSRKCVKFSDSCGDAQRLRRAPMMAGRASDQVLMGTSGLCSFQHIPLPRGRAGRPDAPITFRSYGDERARIEGEALDPAIDISGRSHIVIEGLEISGVRRWLWALANCLVFRASFFTRSRRGV